MSGKSHILILHGAYGRPEENWFPWLKAELEKLGHTADVPPFPTPEGQTLGNWLHIAAKALEGHAPADTILVGHSIGAALALRLAERAKSPYRALFAVAPFARPLGLPDFDPLNATFLEPAWNWAKVRRGAKKIIAIAGNNDPYVPLAVAREAAEATAADFMVVPNGGHLNAAAGYGAFPLLLEELRAFG